MKGITIYVAILAALLFTGSVYAGKAPAMEKNKLTITPEEKVSTDLERLEKLFSEGDYDKAFDMVLSLGRKYGDGVFRIDENRLLGLADHLGVIMNNLPPEAVAAYRKRFDLEAEVRFTEASVLGDPAAYEYVADRYFLSSWGDDAVMILAEADLAQGDFEKAARKLERILVSYPDTDLPKERLMVMLAEAWAHLGREDKVNALRVKLENDDKVYVAGRKVLARRHLTALASGELRKEDRQRSKFRPTRKWTTFGGSNSRDRLPMLNPGLGKKIEEYFVKHFKIKNEKPQGFFYNRNFNFGNSRKAFPFFPSCDGERIYFGWGQRVNVIDLKSGQFVKEIIGSEEPFVENNREIIYSPTIGPDGTLYSSFFGKIWGGEKHRSIDVTMQIARRLLKGYDVESGKKVFDSSRLEDRIIDFDRLIFASPPAVTEDGIYATMNSLRGFVDNHVIALDPDTGRVKWRRPLCSNIIEITTFGYHAREPVPPMLTLDEGQLFVQTNMGALACMEASDGRIHWISEYYQLKVKPPTNYTPHMRKYQWHPAAPVVWGDTIVVAPSDSPYLYAYSKHDGALTWRISASDLGGNLYYFLGVTDGLAVVSGDRVFAIDVKTGKIRWATPSIVSMKGTGKGVITRNSVYVPTEENLLRLDLETGKLVESWDWPEKDDSGNVFIFGEYIVTTTQNGITLFRSEME